MWDHQFANVFSSECSTETRKFYTLKIPLHSNYVYICTFKNTPTPDTTPRTMKSPAHTCISSRIWSGGRAKTSKISPKRKPKAGQMHPLTAAPITPAGRHDKHLSGRPAVEKCSSPMRMIHHSLAFSFITLRIETLGVSLSHSSCSLLSCFWVSCFLNDGWCWKPSSDCCLWTDAWNKERERERERECVCVCVCVCVCEVKVP